MEKIKFHVDVKQTIWVREFHEIEFESEELLQKKLQEMSCKPAFNTDDIDNEFNGFLEQETLFDTTEYMSLEDNDGYSTVEIYAEDGITMLAQNGK